MTVITPHYVTLRLHNGCFVYAILLYLSAGFAFWSKEIIEALYTVLLVIFRHETIATNLYIAIGALEALLVPLL